MLDQLDLPPMVVIWLEPAIRLLLILILWWLLFRFVRVLIRRFEARLLGNAALRAETAFEVRKRVDTLVALLRQGVNIFLFAVLALLVLMQLGVQVGPLIAGAGIIGVAVGFGAQYLVRDIITGFFMVLENQIRVGDFVTINGTSGLVELLTLRTIVLRDGAGTVHVFPHGTVNTLANSTRDWSAYLFNVPVSSKEDPEQAMQVIRAAAKNLREDAVFGTRIIAEAEIWGVDKLDGGFFTISGRIRARPGTQAEVGREFLRRLKLAFERSGIEMASTGQPLMPPAAPPLRPPA